MSTDDTRTRVLHAAGPVFADQGFQAATVRDICQAAGVNVASVNYHFGDKERLYIETVKQAHRSITEQVPLTTWPEGTPPARKLHGFILTLLRRMVVAKSAPWQSRLMLREVLHPTSACKELVQEHFRPHLEVLLGILDEILPRSVPTHRRHQIAFSVVGQCLYYRVAGEVVKMLVEADEREQHFGIEQLADHIAEMCLAALGLSAPLGESAKPSSGGRRRVVRSSRS